MNTILVLVGSLRRESINQRFAQALERLSGERFQFVYADIGALPHYNDDHLDNPPEAVVTLKRQVEEADGLLFVTPEYFRAPPGLLLNALAWGGRPYGSNTWAGKPTAIIGTSPGVIGSAAAQSHLRAILPGLEMLLMGQPEIYFQTKPGLIDENLEITDEQTRAFLGNWVERFDSFVSRINASQRETVAA
jgi:chromate reductase